MTFAVAVPTTGLSGYRFLLRTYDRQLENFSRSPDVRRDIEYFLSHAGDVASSASLVGNPRLLRVALGAFGLEGEVSKTAFVKRILDEGTLDPRSFANRLAEPAWKKFSAAMGFGDFGGRLQRHSVRQEIVDRYRARQFENAVGNVDVDLRLAFNFRREVAEIASRPEAERTGWFSIMGSRPLRAVIEGAFNLPASFGRLDIDAQRSILEERSAQLLGNRSPSVFGDDDAIEKIVSRFLLNAQIRHGSQTTAPGSVALTLLGAGGLGNNARASLFASRFG